LVVKILKNYRFQVSPKAKQKKIGWQNFVLLLASPKRTSNSKTKTFLFRRAERGKSLQNGALARGARLPSGFAARQHLPKMTKL
jgi:hypothetical protein